MHLRKPSTELGRKLIGAHQAVNYAPIEERAMAWARHLAAVRRKYTTAEGALGGLEDCRHAVHRWREARRRLEVARHPAGRFGLEPKDTVAAQSALVEAMPRLEAEARVLISQTQELRQARESWDAVHHRLGTWPGDFRGLVD